LNDVLTAPSSSAAADRMKDAVAAVDLQVLLAPRSVAVIGASANPAGHAGRSLTNLLRTEFAGSVYPVNPKYETLQGVRCYPDIESVPEAPDVVYILLPAPLAVEAARAAGRKGTRFAIICSSGFSELGDEGDSLQSELATIRNEFGIRIIGPNCIGVVSPSGGFVGAPTFNISEVQKSGTLSILSHSGGLAATAFNRAQAVGLGVHSMVSLGNEADVTMAKVLAALAQRQDVRTIALVVEEVREPEFFLEAAHACLRAGKRIVALKTGRSKAGSAAVSGHTGALAGNGAAFSAVMRENGILEAHSLDQLVDTAHLLERCGDLEVGRRVAVVSPSGGEAVYVADQAGAQGLELPEFGDDLVRRLREWMPLGNPGNPLDLTGQIIGNSDILTNVLAALGDEQTIETLLVCLASWGEYDANALLAKVLDAATPTRTPVVFSSWEAGSLTARAVELLSSSGLPWFPSPDRGLAAIALAAQPLHLPGERPDPIRVPFPAGTTAASLGERQALSVLAGAGVQVVESQVVESADLAVAVAEPWDYRVVLKLDAPDILHKTEHGLVEVEVPSGPEGVRAAAGRMLRRGDDQGMRHNGVLVARRESGVEMIVGGIDDPQFGRFVLMGAGGILAEQLDDTVLVSAPADADSVRRALQTLRAWPVLQGVRGRSNDVDGFVDLVVAFSRIFAGSDWMSEVDLNPVMVRSSEEGGAVAVDAMILLADKGAGNE
jgi:acetate---CoA ligase (ADP-forming)